MRFPSLLPLSVLRTPTRTLSAIVSAAGDARLSRTRPALLAFGLAAAVGCSDARDPLGASQPSSGRASSQPARLYTSTGSIKDSYIVVLEDNADPRSVAAVAGVSPMFVYTAALTGFAATLNHGQLTALLHNPNVSYVEQNQPVSLSTTQPNATWGLDRVDQRGLPLDNQFVYGPTGLGVRAYVIDTGIRTDHTQFGGRASVGADVLGGTGQDCGGHGTHVAGTIGGVTYGVAKDVRLIGVRAFDCQGHSDAQTVIAALDWVTANAQKPAVANMSFEMPGNVTVDNAVTRMRDRGVVPVAAAGNWNQNACEISPARVASAITVGATDSNDARSVGLGGQASNWGNCVNLWAPGTNILSAGIASPTDAVPMSGTSMAAPHVSGLVALYLQTDPSATQSKVAWELTQASSTGKLTNLGTGSPNRQAYLLNPPSGCGRLLPGEALRRDQFVNVELKSCNGQALLALQTDQNVVLYDRLGPRWAASNTVNRGTMVLQMQPDGNLVAYAVPSSGGGEWQPLWSSNTQGNPNAWLAIQDDCNMVIYRNPYPQGGPIWSTNTFCR
jgi:subtilisin family serine protease